MRPGRRAAPAGARLPLDARIVPRILALRHRRARDDGGHFFVEGVRFLARAIEQDAAIEVLVVCWKLLTSAFARQQVRRLRRAGVSTVLVTPEQFRAVSSSPRASGVGLVLRQHWTPAEHVDPRCGTAWLLLREVRAPGNLGTLLRTLAAVGGGGALFLGDAADPFDPAVVRATMGALLSLRFARVTEADLRRLKTRRGCVVIGTSPRGEADYATAAWPPGSVVFVGGERKGLGAGDAALCDRVVRIPMVGAIDSLNLGVAGSLVLYEVFRARRAAPGQRGPTT